MPNLFVYDTGRSKTTRFTLAFARGVKRNTQLRAHTAPDRWIVKHDSIQQYLDHGLPSNIDAVATLGILRGTGLLLKEAKQRGIDYYYMDHAYFNPGYGGKSWMRVTKNGHACTTLKPCDATAYNAFAANQEKNLMDYWHGPKGDKIIVCPPTHAVQWFFDDYNWENSIVERLKNILPKDQHDRIVIRHKPKEPIVDERGNLIQLRVNPQTGSLAEDLEQAHCVIAYNSMVALEATLKGIPVITSEHSCCTRVSFQIEDLMYPGVFDIEPTNRQLLLNWLAWNQWKMANLENGTAWDRLQENSN
tara:strand:- start:4251 stop:5162 length:912 start_codon:yes stop_codon:yes gene_type:complete